MSSSEISNDKYLGTGVIILDGLGNAIVNEKDGEADDNGDAYQYAGWSGFWGVDIEAHEKAALSEADACKQAIIMELAQEILNPGLLVDILYPNICWLPKFIDLDSTPWPGTRDAILGYILLEESDFQTVYDHFFTDSTKRENARRDNAVAPHEGMARFIPSDSWTHEFENEKWLCSLAGVTASILNQYTSAKNVPPSVLSR